MAFTRDEITAYEAGPQTGADPNAGKQPVTAARAGEGFETPEPAAKEPAIETQPADGDASASSEESSTSEATADSTESGSDGTSVETAESTPATADPDSEASDEEEAPAPRGRAQERIEGLVSEVKALRKYVEFREKVWSDGKGEKPAATTETAPAPAAQDTDDPAPTLEDHNFDPVAWQRANTEWMDRQIDKKVAKALGKKDADAQAANAKTEAQQVGQRFVERSNEFAKTHADFKTVMENPDLPTLHGDAAAVIVKSEHGPAIAYYLGKHPDQAAKIARLPRDQQLMRIGAIESKVSETTPTTTTTPTPKPTPTKQKTGTKAPPPPTPVPAGSAAQKGPGEMTMDEFVRSERAKELRAREDRKKMRAAMQ